MADPLVNLIHLDRQSPIAKGFVQAGATLTVEATTGIGKVQFLSGTTHDRFAPVFGVEAPGAGASCASGDVTISWLAPDEWLVTGEDVTVQVVLARAEELEDAALAVDLSHARASFLLTGEAARDRLAAHTPLDISDAALPVGHVARAPLADTTMFVARVADAEGVSVFRIIVDQTMAKYAVRMLAGPNAA
ncbi:hypothetical protein NED98_08245 [Sphingomonas sp. MMSM20]|uniref:sarcosine oxidase subunit gamma n=1 Tax=Sphingomonas lycopersici TaxID=2951807 RepID=UPI002238B6EC|nr:sarcosine oxidase subunit gamma family protein [Sphingomonas lycopersici]MCW6530234.1 hypothetical protein [Sphingomonas lycopersici]